MADSVGYLVSMGRRVFLDAEQSIGSSYNFLTYIKVTI